MTAARARPGPLQPSPVRWSVGGAFPLHAPKMGCFRYRNKNLWRSGNAFQEAVDFAHHLVARSAATRRTPCGCSPARPPCRFPRPARAPRPARRSRRCATRSPASAPAACRSVARSAGRRPCARRPTRTAATHCSPCGSPENGEPNVTTALTRSGCVQRQRAREHPAQAPPDHQHRLAGRDRVEPRPQPLDRVGPGAQVPAHLPRMHPPSGGGQRAAQFHRRPVVGDEAGDDQRRRPVLGPARPQMAEPAPRPHAEPRRLVQSASTTAAARRHGPRDLEIFVPAHQRRGALAASRTRPSAVW